MVQNSPKKIIVLGSGNFGTCLAQHLAELGHNPLILSRDKAVADGINQQHKNPKYLNMITLSPRIKATLSLDQNDIDEADLILFALPTQSLREVLKKLPVKPNPENCLLVSACKGIEQNTDALPFAIITAELSAQHAQNAVFLSGPSFAEDIAKHQPTAVVVGSKVLKNAEDVQRIFHAPHFRTYTSTDPIGLELAGALKNVIAIAAGAAAGLGFESNTQAALLSRGLNEMLKLGLACGAQWQSFLGLGGVGDLFLSCSSTKSRNYRVGFQLAQSKPLDAILKDLGSVAEGVYTARAAVQLSQFHGVDTPIMNEVAKVLYEKKDVKKALWDLLNRDAKPEF